MGVRGVVPCIEMEFFFKNVSISDCEGGETEVRDDVAAGSAGVESPDVSVVDSAT